MHPSGAASSRTSPHLTLAAPRESLFAPHPAPRHPAPLSTSSQEVELVQFMGKDNVPFHTVIFPATQLGSGQKWTMMQSISVTEYLHYEDGTFSKSRGVGEYLMCRVCARVCV